jgi:hypothetical protein
MINLRAKIKFVDKENYNGDIKFRMCHNDHTLSFVDFCKTHRGEDNFGELWFDASKEKASFRQLNTIIFI